MDVIGRELFSRSSLSSEKSASDTDASGSKAREDDGSGFACEREKSSKEDGSSRAEAAEDGSAAFVGWG